MNVDGLSMTSRSVVVCIMICGVLIFLAFFPTYGFPCDMFSYGMGTGVRKFMDFLVYLGWPTVHEVVTAWLA